MVHEVGAAVDGGGGFGVEKTLLNVLDGEHEKIPWGQVIGLV